MKTDPEIIVKGKTIDEQTRCIHYHSALDIIAIKFKCCHSYYPCFQCHREEADHQAVRWSQEEYDEKAILCGACQMELTINQYMDSNYTCPNCRSPFNPGCYNHNHLYFEG